MQMGLDLFTRFGGVRPMAVAIGEAPSSVQGWKRRRHVPAKKQALVLHRAGELGLDITAEDVMFPFPEDRVPADG